MLTSLTKAARKAVNGAARKIAGQRAPAPDAAFVAEPREGAGVAEPKTQRFEMRFDPLTLPGLGVPGMPGLVRKAPPTIGDDRRADASDGVLVTRSVPIEGTSAPTPPAPAADVAHARAALASILAALRARFAKRRSLVAVSCAALLAGSLLGALIPVSTRTSARGVLGSQGEGHALLAPVGGIVRELVLAAGAEVAAGQIVLTIEPLALRAELEQVVSELQGLELRHANETKVAAQREQLLNALYDQAELLQRRSTRNEEWLRNLGSTAHKPGGSDELTEQVAELTSTQLRLQQQLTYNRFRQLKLERERTSDAQSVGAELEAAQAKRRVLEAAIERSQVLAPARGIIYALGVHVGEQVDRGRLLGRVVPIEPPTRAVVYVEGVQRDALRVGAPAKVYLNDSMAVDGRTVAVASMASREHERVADGSIAPAYRVEIQLTPRSEDRAALSRLLPGTQVDAAIDGTSRRLIQVALDGCMALLKGLAG